nr:hypothetical protein Itr_chr04CG21990 [Ipomoea trifida]
MCCELKKKESKLIPEIKMPKLKNSTDETIAKLLDWKFSAANAQSAAANNRLSPSGNHRTESGEKHDDPSPFKHTSFILLRLQPYLRFQHATVARISWHQFDRRT